jgi:hypothetical protein
VRDVDIGCWEVRKIDKKLAMVNADSYVWLALELFWRGECTARGPLQEPNEFDC